MITDRQARILIKMLGKGKSLINAASKADMDEINTLFISSVLYCLTGVCLIISKISLLGIILLLIGASIGLKGRRDLDKR
ncbi:MAG: hypothetical protein JXA79_05345 [Deltaproteobacteria bacterium]|nr:hypothetical protein [Deltaproteobacteria bacterium]